MAKNILILNKSDYMKWTDLSKNTPDSKIDYATRGGQRKYLKPVIGEDLYNKVIDEIDTTPNEPYLTLINEYINPFLVLKCFRDVLSDSTAIHSATGAKSITDNGNNQTEVNGSVLGIRLRHLDSDANLFKNELINYLDGNTGLFPEYESSCVNKARVNRVYFSQVRKKYNV